MRALVTGGAGFIGSHLVDALLTRGDEVIVLDNLYTGSRANIPAGVEFVYRDVCDEFRVHCDVLYHLGCPASPKHYQRDPAHTIETAVLGTRNALLCARDVGARIVIASTSEVYGDPEVSPQREDYWGHVNPVGPRACYDESKRCAESLAMAFHKQWGTDVRIARIFNTYGPRMQAGDGRLLPNMITQVLAGEAATVYGDGKQTRSFCYVSDTVEALMRLGGVTWDPNGPRIVNIGNPDERTILQVAMDVIRVCDGDRGNFDFLPLPADDPKQRCPDIMRAKIMLDGWHPTVSYEEGLRRTVEWFRGNVKQKAA